MSLFDKFKKKEAETVQWPVLIGAAVNGTVIPMEQIPDEVFSAGVLGPCIGIEPEDGKICAPADGKIIQLADTLHAVGLQLAGGVEVLIHVGIDTVEMNGDGFRSMVKEGATVKAGTQLLEMDIAKVQAAGHPAAVITIVTNADDFASVEPVASGDIKACDTLFRVSK